LYRNQRPLDARRGQRKTDMREGSLRKAAVATLAPLLAVSALSDKAFLVRAGSKDRTREREMAKIVVHLGRNWNHDPAELADDVTMLLLDHAATVQPLPLADRPTEPRQTIGPCGWGLDEPNTAEDGPLRLAPVNDPRPHPCQVTRRTGRP
jgi:hypothetical protein